jgi:hypothetical protein
MTTAHHQPRETCCRYDLGRAPARQRSSSPRRQQVTRTLFVRQPMDRLQRRRRQKRRRTSSIHCQSQPAKMLVVQRQSWSRAPPRPCCQRRRGILLHRSHRQPAHDRDQVIIIIAAAFSGYMSFSRCSCGTNFIAIKIPSYHVIS